ncbi:RDD family protein [Oleiharenicola lentus]|uniref:RDD family protein n=1 Tax=Oleiharenicola lentus TaxID=2508720 RepID=UPI003F6619D5
MFIILGADGKEYGPVKARLVHEWVAEGRANLETQMRRDGETGWKRLGDFPEFSDAPATSAVSTPPVVTEPPPIPANAPIAAISKTETALAPRELRLAGAVIDGLLKTLCFLPTTLPLYRFVQERSLDNPPPSMQETFTATSQILADNLSKSFPFLIGLVIVQMTLITLRGQSVGKLLLRMRIVRHTDETHAGFLRGFFIRSFLPALVQQLPLIGMLFWIVDTCFIFRGDHRCLHDLAAGTKVISVRKSQD